MREEDEKIKIQTITPVDVFEGIKGRRPKSPEELEEWLGTSEGKTAMIFESASFSRWGELGRS